MRYLKNVIFLAVVTIFLSSCTKTTTIRSGRNYQNALANASGVSVLPPMVESNTVDASGSATRNYNYEYRIEEILADMVVEKLNTKGYKAKHITKKQIHDQKISRTMLELQEDYMEHIKALYKPLVWEEKKSIDLDIELTKSQNMKQQLDTDIVVFSEYYLKQKSSGSVAKDATVSLLSAVVGVRTYEDPIEGAAESAALRVTIIDASSNKLIWSNIIREGYSAWGAAFGNAKDIDKVERKRLIALLDRLFITLPKKN